MKGVEDTAMTSPNALPSIVRTTAATQKATARTMMKNPKSQRTNNKERNQHKMTKYQKSKQRSGCRSLRMSFPRNISARCRDLLTLSMR